MGLLDHKVQDFPISVGERIFTDYVILNIILAELITSL